ncbi:MAG: hypothetical protein ACRDOO_22595 [Actinomadura sp.]
MGTTDPSAQAEERFELQARRPLPLPLIVGFLCTGGAILAGGTLFFFFEINSTSLGDYLIIAAVWLLSLIFGSMLLWASSARNYVCTDRSNFSYRIGLSGTIQIPWSDIVELTITREIRSGATYPVVIAVTQRTSREVAIQLRGVTVTPDTLARHIRRFLPDEIDLHERY